jgi:hypothetical protein
MTNPKDELARVLREAEEAAYNRGWDDACVAMGKAAIAMKAETFELPPEKDDLPTISTTHPLPPPRRTGRPSSNTIGIVEACISASPGLRGVMVVEAAQSIDSAINERTVRTCLRRLKQSKKIWQRNGLWYPKSKSRPEHEHEEAISSPPQ